MINKLSQQDREYIETQIRELARMIRNNIKMDLIEAAKYNLRNLNSFRMDLGLERVKSVDNAEDGLTKKEELNIKP